MPISKFVSCLFSPHKLNRFLRRIFKTYQYGLFVAMSVFALALDALPCDVALADRLKLYVR